tara:strand:- start:141 stop:617 length:477 start_codon:yes stop_codon:yes gene_type:complete
MKRGMNRRGISPVIASVLLIALVLVLAAIIFLWARGFISEQIEKFGTPIEDLCAEVNFDIEVVASNVSYNFEVANRGNVPIHNFDIKEIKGGESEIQKFKFGVDEGESVRRPVSLKTDTEKIVVYPSLIGNIRGKSINKAFTCSEHGVTLVKSDTEWH